MISIQLQDAMERMAYTTDYAYFIDFVAKRRNDYLQALSICDAENVGEVAKLQGRVQALDEVIRVRQDAEDAKEQRTHNG